MNYITGSSRHQTYFATLDDQVSVNNAVRLLDVFEDMLDPIAIGLHYFLALFRLVKYISTIQKDNKSVIILPFRVIRVPFFT
ncbi:MAG: hypothetical protein SGI96_19635 [Bacteroidota bacterium]|nr:hypothetical protein [Chitinophagaceae bacterium]MDZ4810455.1 hypothetical protein [Bacteroidota bacterium]